MDEFSQKIMATAQERQKFLDSKLTDLGVNKKFHLHESQPNVSTEATRNFDELAKIKRKEINSDSIISHKFMSQCKENIPDLSISNSSKSKLSGLTKVSSEMPGKNNLNSSHKTLNIQKENFEMEIKFKSTDDMRLEVEIEERDINNSNQNVKNDNNMAHKDEEKESRKDVKSRLKQLGRLYMEDSELSSPIQRTEEKFHQDLSSSNENNPIVINSRLQETKARRNRLAALASNLNKWEDEVSHPKNKIVESEKKSPKKSWKPPAPKPPTDKIFTSTSESLDSTSKPQRTKTLVTDEDSSTSNSIKQLHWDKKVLDSLESQGFTRAESRSKLVYDYSHSKSTNDLKSLETGKEEMKKSLSDKNCSNIDNSISSPSKKINAKFHVNVAEIEEKNNQPEIIINKSGPKSSNKNVLSKAALFEENNVVKQKDPALLSVLERKALFEKNKGEALIPKAAFAMAVPTQKTKPDSKILTKQLPTVVETIEKPHLLTKNENSGIADKLKALLHQATTISESQIRHAREKEKQTELNMLKSRFNKNKEIIRKDEEVESNSDTESSDNENENITETTKMIRKPKSKIVSFKQSRESLSSLTSKKSLDVKSSINESKLSKNNENISERKIQSENSKRRSTGDSPIVQAVLDDVKRIKVTSPKNGQLYPCLSDIEASTANEGETTDAEHGNSPDNTDNEENNSSLTEENESSITESEMADTSFGREVLAAVNCNQGNLKKRSYLDGSTTSSELSDVLNEMNDYLDDQSSDTEDLGPTPPKNTRTSPSKFVKSSTISTSFNYKNQHLSPNNKQNFTVTNVFKSPIKRLSPNNEEEILPTHVLEGDATVPLIHTVSFYRRQQNQEQRTPVRKIIRKNIEKEEIKEEQELEKKEELDSKLVDEKIQQLNDEICKQQTVISQSSQALNLCSLTFEFSGSSEEVEAERLLLLATQRRQAALHELQRLRIERTLNPVSTNLRSNSFNIDKCNISISEIVLPLKRDYICALTAAGGLGHHLLCLIKYNEHVFATPLVATGSPPNPPQMCVRIPGTLKLNHLYPDFTITVEVYSMQAHEEILPHEVKYHINGKDKKSSKLLTPKKLKQLHDTKLTKPPLQSPAGPSAVRTSSFQLMGYIIFSIKEINRTQWSLNKVPYVSPLEGTIQMNVQCDISMNVEIRGFLTMFEDVSGFGAWHRRWCYLKGETLSYWKYPDDERRKAPINSISLQGCVTENVNLVSRDICARPNTFLLEFIRPKQSNDTDSLIMVVRKTDTLIRYLFSADTKEERIEWCQQLNKALASMNSLSKKK